MYGGNKYELDIARSISDHKVTLYNVFNPMGDAHTISFAQLLARLFIFKLVITNLTGNIFASIALFWIKRCVIIHHIDWRGSPTLSRWLQKIEVFVLLWLTPRSTAIVVVSRVWARHLRRLGFKDITIIYNAYDLTKYNVDPKRKAEVLRANGLDRHRLAYIGNGLKRKGCHIAAQALADQGVRLIATGVQSDIENISNLTALNLPFEDYLCLLSACEVALLLSQFREGWNRTAHECILLGVPVIGSPRGGMRELLQSTHQTFAGTAQQARYKFLHGDYGLRPNDLQAAREHRFTDDAFMDSWRQLITRLLLNSRQIEGVCNNTTPKLAGRNDLRCQRSISGDSYHFVFDVAEYGGHEMVTLAIASALAQHHKVRITAPAYNVALAQALTSLQASATGIHIDLLGGSHDGRTSYLARLALILFREREKHTVTIIPQGWPTGAMVAVVAAWATRTPNVVSYLPMWVQATGSLPVLALKSLAMVLCRTTFSRVVTISDPIALKLRERYADTIVATLENRVKPPCLRLTKPARVREELGLPLGTSVVGIIGRIDFKQKGQDRLLDAIVRSKELQDFVFAFFGTGPDEAELTHRIAEVNATDRVFLLPWRSDITSLLHGFDVIAMPSRFEGVPLVMLEALLSGIPFVGSLEIKNCISGLKAGIFCDFDNPADVSRAIAIGASDQEAVLTPAGWQELMSRFCTDDDIYLSHCEAAFAGTLR